MASRLLGGVAPPAIEILCAARPMADPVRIHQGAGCEIFEHPGYLRASVGPGLADEVPGCPRALAATCITRSCRRVLVIGYASLASFYHLAGRDALRSIALAGVPVDFLLTHLAMHAGLI